LRYDFYRPLISRGQITLALVAILIVAAVLRLLGIDYGLPHPLVSDEEILVGGALRMAQTGSFIPTLDPVLAEQLYYPIGLPYAYLALYAPLTGVLFAIAGFPPLADLPGVLLTELGLFFLAARLLGAAFSIATVWLIYRLAAAMFASPAAGLFGAALLSVSWFHVLLSHFARHWSATVFFTWLTVWLAWRYYENPNMRRAIWCGLAAAAGFAVGYIAILGYGAFGLLHLLRYRARFLNRFLFWSLMIFAAGALTTGLLHVPAIERLVGGSEPVLPVDQSKSLVGYLDTLSFYMGALWRGEPALLVFGVAGGVIGLVRFPYHVLALAAAFLSYTIFLDFFLPLEDRYILPVIPALALLAGAGAAVLEVCSFHRMRVVGIVGLFTLGLIYAGWNAVTLDRLLLADDSRERAIRWITENVEPTEGVAIAMNPVKLPASIAGLRIQEILNSSSLDAQDRFALSSGRGGAFLAVHFNRFARSSLEGTLGEKLLADLREAGFRYFVVSQRHDLPLTRLHQQLRNTVQPIEIYDSAAKDAGLMPPDLRTTTLVQNRMVHDYSRLEYLGPRVEIYDLQRSSLETRP
jgi:MFS family permease